MTSDKNKWNSRYQNKDMMPPSAPSFIIESMPFMLSGSVLDIASGDGAAALYLSEQGFDVTAIDISNIALHRLEQFANDKGRTIVTKVVDLDDYAPLSSLPQYDNIVVTCFKPSAQQWLAILSHLKIGGVLVMSTFNIEQHHKRGFPERFCLHPDELKSLHSDLTLSHYASIVRDDSHMDDYRFIKQPY